jgi:import inner membrane translocase subunit TIM50
MSSGLRASSTSGGTSPSGGTTGLGSTIIGNFTPEDEAKEKAEKEEKRKRQTRITNYTLIGLGCFFVGGSVLALSEWGKPHTDDQGNEVLDEFSQYSLPKQYVLRTLDTFKNYNEVMKEPAREELLPPPLRYPYLQPSYTLVLEMTGILIHPEWTYKTGWRFKKRPFVDYFLQQVGPPLFEVVIFTQEGGFTATPLLDSIDPNGYIMYRLFRDSTRYVDGNRVKDLNNLNRDLNRVIFVDCNPDACKMNRDNCLILKKWEGTDGDKTLFDLAQFLRAVATQGVDDVREVIQHYNQFDDPLEAFKENQRRLLEKEEEQMRQQTVTTQSSSLVKSFKRK